MKVHFNFQYSLNKPYIQGSIFILLGAIFFAILMRNSGLYPSIFADEYVYSTFSRLLPLSESLQSNYLYLAIYKLTLVCGNGFLNCARILNIIFFFIGAAFIFLTAKRLVNTNTAIFLSIFVLIGPINVYTSFYMPEAMYFCFFWLYAYQILNINESNNWWAWSITGLLIAICSLIKQHGLFLLLPTSLYIMYFCKTTSANWIKKSFQIIILVFFTTLAIKIIIGFMITGDAIISIWGKTYSQTIIDFYKNLTLNDKNVTSTALNITPTSLGVTPQNLELQNNAPRHLVSIHSVLVLMRQFFINLSGQVIALFLLFGLPMAYLLISLIPYSSDRQSPSRARFIFFTLVLLGSLVGASTLFSSMMTTTYDGNIFRIQMRYYNFLFPLLLIAGAMSGLIINKNYKFNILIKLLTVLIILLGIITYVSPFTPNAIDTPELIGLTYSKPIFYFIGFLNVAILLIYFYRPKLGAYGYIFILVPLSTILFTVNINKNLESRFKPDIYDQAGIFVKSFLSAQALSNLVVVGDNFYLLTRTLFYVDNPNASYQTIPGSSSYESANIPAGKKWILLVGKHQMADDIPNQIHGNGFILAGGDGKYQIDFSSQSLDPSLLKKSSGFFMPPEKWGTWSVAEKATLSFTFPLPEAFYLEINAKAFGPNVNKPITISLGNFSQTINLTNQFERKTIYLNNPFKLQEIKFLIPQPTSPFELNIGEDKRKLGIAITDLKIYW